MHLVVDKGPVVDARAGGEDALAVELAGAKLALVVQALGMRTKPRVRRARRGREGTGSVGVGGRESERKEKPMKAA